MKWVLDSETVKSYRFSIDDAVVFVDGGGAKRKLSLPTDFGDPKVDHGGGVFQLTDFRKVAGAMPYQIVINVHDRNSGRICSSDPFIWND